MCWKDWTLKVSGLGQESYREGKLQGSRFSKRLLVGGVA